MLLKYAVTGEIYLSKQYEYKPLQSIYSLCQIFSWQFKYEQNHREVQDM